MARIRTIKPEFPQSESMGRVSREARLLFVNLWTLSDDAGRARGASRMLASLLYPYDDDAPSLIDGWLAELEAEGCVTRYISDGSTYLQINKWLEHQKIDKPSKSKIPEFAEPSRTVENIREPSATDLGPRTCTKGPRTETARAARATDAGKPGEPEFANPGSPETELNRKAVAVIAAFDASRAAIFGEAQARPWPASDDLSHAKAMLETGASVETCRATFDAVNQKLKGLGHAPRDKLKSMLGDVVLAVKPVGDPAFFAIPKGFQRQQPKPSTNLAVGTPEHKKWLADNGLAAETCSSAESAA